MISELSSLEENIKITQFLLPGDLYTTKEPAIFKTVLGSCISICLYDKNKKIGGMNHFIFADSQGKKISNHYGDISSENLIKKMISLGSKPEDLSAQVYGGASGFPESSLLTPGINNIKIALQVLKDWNIAIEIEDTGGCFGRKILFDTRNGTIEAKKLETCLRQCKNDKTCNHSI